MKTLRIVALLAVASVLIPPVFAQQSGFFFQAGAGVARLQSGDFAVYNPLASIPGQPLGEALPALDQTSRVSVVRLTLGYAFMENWDLRLSYTDYGTGDVQLAFPVYPGIFFAVAPDHYERHEMIFDSTTIALLPVYTHPLSDQLKLKIGAGLNYSHTSAHIETAYSSGAILPRPPATAHSYADAAESTLGYILLLGADYLISDQLSIGLGLDYGTMKVKVPATPWANRSKSSVRLTTIGAELAATWRW